LRETTAPTASMLASQKASEKAVSSGRISADAVARQTFEAIRENRFYVITHPKILASVELRLQDVVAPRNPSDPFSFQPDVAHRPEWRLRRSRPATSSASRQTSGCTTRRAASPARR